MSGGWVELERCVFAVPDFLPLIRWPRGGGWDRALLVGLGIGSGAPDVAVYISSELRIADAKAALVAIKNRPQRMPLNDKGGYRFAFGKEGNAASPPLHFFGVFLHCFELPVAFCAVCNIGQLSAT